MKDLKNSSLATNFEIRKKNPNMEEKTKNERNFIKKNFPKFSKKVIFDSSKHSISNINSVINGKQNLVIFMETESNLIFGGYFSIPFPIYQPHYNYAFYKDLDSCIFEVTKKIKCNAHPAATRHLDTHENYYFRFGCFGQGINLRKDFRIFYGKPTDNFQGDSSFGFTPMEEEAKRVVIYQLSDKIPQK